MIIRQVFGAGAFAWAKPAIPIGFTVLNFTIECAGPGGGGPSGRLTQSSISGDPGGSTAPAGSAGGYCLYTPNFALVPAIVNGVVGAGGVGGATTQGVGSLVGNTVAPNKGADGSAATNIAAGVIVCNQGVGTGASNPGGTAACTNAWGGASITQQGGEAGQSNNLIPGNPPTSAALQSSANGAGFSVSTKYAGGGGGQGYFNNANLGQIVGCYGGVGSLGLSVAPAADHYLTGLGPGIPGLVLRASPNAANPGEGGPSGPSITISPTSSPAGNVSTWTAGAGGNGTPGAGGGVGGSVAMTAFANPGTMNSGPGGNGGDGFAIFTLTLGNVGLLDMSILPVTPLANWERPISVTGAFKA